MKFKVEKDAILMLKFAASWILAICDISSNFKRDLV